METLIKILEIILKGRWQWQSNPDPWSKAESPQWKSYPLDQNYLIEKAYYEKKHEVDIGDHIVSIKHMIQKKKGSVVSQRSIRRIDWIDDVHDIDRSERYFETELPKTINKVFGSLGDFISFFSRRNPEILEFTNDFKDLETSNDLDILNQKIVPKLVNCLEEVLLKSNEEQLKDSSLSHFKKKMLLKMKERIEKLISLFQTESLSVQEFYGRVLRAYTMDTDLYPILNNSLRNENWVEVDRLLHYAFCFCKAFFNLRLKTNFAQDKKTPSSSMLLYRGTAFDELSLSFYNTKKVQHFSWNSVTSTTKAKEIAEEFMYKSADLANKKYPVLFVIEVPLADEFESEYLKWIDIQLYSMIPKENEVVLPPGSVFELIEVFTNPDQISIIKIKLRNEITSLAHGGMMMQGALHSQLMTEKEAKIMCLEGEELNQALIGISGNKLIEEVEFCLCIFNKRLLMKMFEILPTLERGKVLKFIACSFEDNGELTDEGPMEGKMCGIIKLEIIGANNFFQMICNEKWDQKYWIALRELEFDFRSRINLKDEELDEVSQGLEYLPQLTSLNMNFEGCYCITDAGVNILAHSLNSLTHLTYFNINFEECNDITDNGMDILAHSLYSLTHLTYLEINFREYKKVISNRINTLAFQGLKFLSQLKTLNLYFHGLENASLLCQGLRYSTQLTSLTLGLLRFDAKELNSFVDDGLKHLLQLTSLTLQFRSNTYKEITDKELTVFASQGLKSLLSLTSLDLRFTDLDQITDKGVVSLASQGLKHLIHLKSLALMFDYSPKITNKGVASLASRGLKHLIHLKSLALMFKNSPKITNKGVDSLASRGLKHLIHLKSLALMFDYSPKITDKGLSSLMSQGLKNLTQLISLTLNFDDTCITEKGMKNLVSKWLRNLLIFESLTVYGTQLETIDIQTQQQLKNSSRVKLARESSQKYKQSLNEEFSLEVCSLTLSLRHFKKENPRNFSQNGFYCLFSTFLVSHCF